MKEPDEVIEDTEMIGEVELKPKPSPRKRTPQKRAAAKPKAKPAPKAEPKAKSDAKAETDPEPGPFDDEYNTAINAVEAETQRIHDEVGAVHQATRDNLDERLSAAQARAGDNYQKFRDQYLAVPLRGNLR